jgi:hypothetical protein
MVFKVGVALALCPMMGPLALSLATAAYSENVKFESGPWVTECDFSRQQDQACSAIGVFGTTLPNGTKGSFSLLVDFTDERVAVVGKPTPTRATVQVDKNPSMGCTTSPCIFSEADSNAITRQLKAGSLILIDVMTARATFRTSLSTQGYRAGIAKLLANAPH